MRYTILILGTPIILTFRIYVSEGVRISGDFSRQKVRGTNVLGTLAWNISVRFRDDRNYVSQTDMQYCTFT
jgi:hypothetical protein